MTESEMNESPPLVHNIWSRLLLNVAHTRKQLSQESGDDALILSAVERQTENSRKGGTIWEAVRKADEEGFKRLVTENPENVNARGPVGECPIHMLFLYGTETHLNMARYLITNFPHTITQIYNLPVSR
jgi:ankyrin repeat protein